MTSDDRATEILVMLGLTPSNNGTKLAELKAMLLSAERDTANRIWEEAAQIVGRSPMFCPDEKKLQRQLAKALRSRISGD
jgi:hypothetical protein